MLFGSYNLIFLLFFFCIVPTDQVSSNNKNLLFQKAPFQNLNQTLHLRTMDIHFNERKKKKKKKYIYIYIYKAVFYCGTKTRNKNYSNATFLSWNKCWETLYTVLPSIGTASALRVLLLRKKENFNFFLQFIIFSNNIKKLNNLLINNLKNC